MPLGLAYSYIQRVYGSMLFDQVAAVSYRVLTTQLAEEPESFHTTMERHIAWHQEVKS